MNRHNKPGIPVSAEKKLQLVRQIREEHQNNQNAVRGREAFLYGKSFSALKESEMDDNMEEGLRFSTLRLRITTALFLFGIFYVFVSSKKDFLGIHVSQVYEAVETDYSPILFDFIEEIPYTLHE